MIQEYQHFIGSSYSTQSAAWGAERLVNMYEEVSESGGTKTPAVLFARSGLGLFSQPSGSIHRGAFYQEGTIPATGPNSPDNSTQRSFIVVGQNFYEIYRDGEGDFYGVVADDGRQATIHSNGVQLFIVSGGLGYIFDLTANTLTQIMGQPGFPANCTMGEYLDGYFIALWANSRTISISGLYDGLAWSGTDQTTVSSDTDNLVSIKVDHNRLWLLGGQNTHPYYNSGDTFPFSPIQGVQVEQGCLAEFSVAQLDNTIFWLGGDDRGAGIVWRMSGYLPERVSDHALEETIQSYTVDAAIPSALDISNAIGWTCQERGHFFYVLYFPSVDKTWAFDAKTEKWAEWTYLNPSTGQPEAHRARTHMFAFGYHLVGDRATGDMYVQTNRLLTDNGDPMERIRQAAYISNLQQWVIHNSFQLDIQAGVGLDVASDAAGYDPVVMFKWSDDGYTWSNEYQLGLGRRGQYKFRCYRERLGKSRNRIYQVKITDPVTSVWMRAILDLEPLAE